MSKTPRDTDERLRSWLDSNQLDRERMCQALLSLDTRFREIRPRHPRGGRDGGRDLEAKLLDGRELWAAIGFRNSVSDSDADRKWVKEKFGDDLERALEVSPSLKGFVFMTNVELRVGERNNLVKKAHKSGIEFVDIFHRERLRILLDGPEGLAARYQYLGIALTEEEQATFFARWGSDIEQLMGKQFAAVDKQLARLEFLHACTRPLRYLSIQFTLNSPTTPAALGHFRMLLMIGNIEGAAPFTGIELAARSGIPGRKKDGDAATSGGLWITPRPGLIKGKSESDDDVTDDKRRDRIGSTTFQSALTSEVRFLGANGSITGWLSDLIPLPTLGDLDESFLAILVTAPLSQLIREIRVTANEYTLLHATSHNFRIYRGRTDQWNDVWYESLSEEELSVPWIRIDINGSATHLDFAGNTPPRLYRAISQADDIEHGS